ncbi:TPA: hypothetical protein LA460_000135 [Clostridium botulinum]|nr:hypothetical protein [Clostridium botulinum]HBJ1652740.1 hypothetical protein [Clostridium botulinum]
MKELNIIEAIEMPIGTEFEVIDKYGDKNLVNVILCENNNLCRQSERLLCWKNSYKELGSGNYELTLKFIPIQQPVSFMEAISDEENMVKVILDSDDFFSSDAECFNDYMTITELFKKLSERFNNYGILKAINKGKWYIK